MFALRNSTTKGGEFRKIIHHYFKINILIVRPSIVSNQSNCFDKDFNLNRDNEYVRRSLVMMNVFSLALV